MKYEEMVIIDKKTGAMYYPNTKATKEDIQNLIKGINNGILVEDIYENENIVIEKRCKVYR